MTTTYILKSANSDLSKGADFDKELSVGTETAGSIVVAITGTVPAFESSWGFTPPDNPGAVGNFSGFTYTAEINVLTGNSNIEFLCKAHRLNASGVVQGSSEDSGSQVATAGVHSFSMGTIISPLGAFQSGDRLGIEYVFRNTSMKEASVTIETGTTDTEVVAPWTLESGGTAVPVFRHHYEMLQRR